MQDSGPSSNPSIHQVADKVASRKPPIAPVQSPKHPMTRTGTNFHIILRGSPYAVVGLPLLDRGFAGFRETLSDHHLRNKTAYKKPPKRSSKPPDSIGFEEKKNPKNMLMIPAMKRVVATGQTCQKRATPDLRYKVRAPWNRILAITRNNPLGPREPDGEKNPTNMNNIPVRNKVLAMG